MTKKAEPYVFVALILLNLFPILSNKFFPTMDGPAHLYNSNLLKEIITNPSTKLLSYYSFNDQIVNWLDHVLLTSFLLILPAYLAEKLLLFIYIAGLPLAFRELIKSLAPQNIELSSIIFPILYTFLFILGFYNYSLALIILLILCNYYIKNINKISARSLVVFFALFTLLFYAHVFVFSIGILIILLLFAAETIQHLVNNTRNVKFLLGKAIILIISACIGIIHFLSFITKNPADIKNVEKIGFYELLNWIVTLRPTIAYSRTGESRYTILLFIIYLISAAIILFIRFKNSKKNTFNNHSVKRKMDKKIFIHVYIYDIWLLISILLTILFFIIPNYIGGIGGHISFRIGIIAIISYLIWLVANNIPSLLKKINIIVAIAICILLIPRYHRKISKLNEEIPGILNAGKIIESHSTVLPVRLSDYWLHTHYSNYLGVNKPMIILENYEASSGYFPLVWNREKIPNLLFGNLKDEEICINIPHTNSRKTEIIDYVFVYGKDPNTMRCHEKVNHILSKYYQVAYATEDEMIKLYKIRNIPIE